MSEGGYNTLPDIVSASLALGQHETGLVFELGKLLVSYNLQSRFAICLVHKHFNIEDEEQVVDLRSGKDTNLVVSSVFTRGTPSDRVVRKYRLCVPASPFIVPSKFCVSESGLIPYEFDCTEADSANPPDRDTAVNGLFLTKWVQMLKRKGTTAPLGLALLGSTDAMIRRERSFPAERVNITTEGDEGIEKYVPTMWNIAESGEPKVCCACECGVD